MGFDILQVLGKMGEGKRRIIKVEGISQARANNVKAREEEEWGTAMLFLAKGPSATLQFLPEKSKALLYAYKAQALDGPCPSGQDGSLAIDHALRVKQEAWKALGDMPRAQAKREFIDLLTEVLPEWKNWYNSYAAKVQKEENVDESAKILREFFQRNALRANL
uniref:ACB domain-containing protein n=1 Tax=Picea sitchensis TaxID=3332 RepID=A9NTM9_PICSI|nr:unknown [Picea sitchensis]